MFRSRQFFILCIIGYFFLSSCAIPEQKICIKNGKEYCINPDWIYVMDWDSCYRRGLSCMEGECWEYAIEEFKQATSFRYKEKRDARSHGMHFRDYFPHREMGICYLKWDPNDLEKVQKAIDELEISMHQTQSARAKDYLNQARRSHLLITGLDTLPPSITLNVSEKETLTNQTSFTLKGKVLDDQYVASVIINQDPLLIELADPNITFTVPIDLKDGENTIYIVARDLVDKEVEKSLYVYLDRQGPKVIINPVKYEKIAGSDQALLTAVVYDESGVLSFKLDKKEVPKLGSEQIFLIEHSIPFTKDKQLVSFWANDRAGNITQGVIDLSPKKGRRRLNLAMRLACNDPQMSHIAMTASEDPISIHMTQPPQEEYTTYKPEIPVEGIIKAENGIQLIQLNDEKLLEDGNEAKTFIERDRQQINQDATQKNIDLEETHKKFSDATKSNNTLFFPINKRISLTEEITYLNFFVKDTIGNYATRYYSIHKVHKEIILKSYERMFLAIIPFDVMRPDICDYKCQEYIYYTIKKSFKDSGRFNYIEEKALEQLFSGELIEIACKTGKMCDENIAQRIGAETFAEGIICGSIQKWKDGMEIDLRLREPEKGGSRLFQDIHTSENTSEALREVISKLTKKFHGSFPVCTGKIKYKKEEIIHADIGVDNKILPCMRYNIFDFENEKELITKARIRNVWQNSSEAEILDEEKIIGIKKGFGVRTR